MVRSTSDCGQLFLTVLPPAVVIAMALFYSKDLSHLEMTMQQDTTFPVE